MNDYYQNPVTKSFSLLLCTNNSCRETFDNDSLSLQVYAYAEEIDYAFNNESLYKITEDGDNWLKLSTTTKNGDQKIINKMGMWDELRGIAGS